MKTYNHHPQWYNQPLRLQEEQINNPNLVFDDFFECYHLHEVRGIMWTWVVEVISSPHSISSDHHERNNHLYFYEKMESLVEAAWIINRGKAPIADCPDCKAVPTTVKRPVVNELCTRYTKPERLIEKVATKPAEVITEVFSNVPIKDLQEYLLPAWFRVAMINAQSPYSAGNGREILYEFYGQLLPFVEALYLTVENDQFGELSNIITGFFQQFSIEYVRRELCDFLDAGIGHDGTYPDGFTPWQAWMTYNHIVCLVEAAYQLYVNKEMECVAEVTKEVEVVGMD